MWKPEGGYDESKTARYYLRNRETGGYLYLEAGSDYVKEGEIKDWRENWGKWEISQSGDFIRLKNVVSGEYLYKDANNDALKNGNVDESDDSSWWRASFENGDLVMRTKEDWNLGICAGDGKGRARCDVMNDRSEEASQWELVEILE